MDGFITTNGTVFNLNGDDFRFVGANIRGLLYYGREYHLLRHSHKSDVDAQLDAAQRMGAKVVRVFGANKHLKTEKTIERLHHILHKLKEKDMYLIFSFTDVHQDTGFNVRGDEEFYQGNYLDYSWYTGGYQRNYLPFVQEIVRTFKEHRRIFAWELGNELKAHQGDTILPDLFIQFAEDVSDEIRSIDANHIITTGVIDGGNLGCTDSQIRRLYQSFDFMTFHVYYPDNHIEVDRAEHEAGLAQSMDMPFIVEEFGIAENNRANPTQQELQHWFNEKGAAGVMQWGLMGTDYDNGDGDSNYGVDDVFVHPYNHKGDFQGILDAYKVESLSLNPWYIDKSVIL